MRILSTRIGLITTISEIAGYKAGLALTRKEIIHHLPAFKGYLVGHDKTEFSLRAEVYEEMIGKLLYNIGNISTPTPGFPGITMYHKYMNDSKKRTLFEKIFQLFLDMFPELMADSPKNNEPINVTPFLDISQAKYDKPGLKMAIELVEQIQLYLHVNPMSGFRYQNWCNTIELIDLFKSESLDTFYGKFFDQRFIDYLYRNFDTIDKINWRKFEGLTCEFFEKAGFYVEIGSGRNDNNIDARIWPKNKNKSLPPAIIIQCKRQKEKISKLIIKALWADMSAEDAQSGLIVTTSALSPGAEKVCRARSYSIGQANRKTLKIWIEKMCSPYTGVFMGE